MSWLDWLYESDPVFRYKKLEGPLTVPDPRWNQWGEEPDTGARALPPQGERPPDIDLSGGYSDIPEQIGTERTQRKTKLGKALLDVMPRMLEAGIAGAATPNIAGGGPTDFFRAAQAGRQALDRRDASRLAMEQQAQDRARQQELQQSQMEENYAQAGYYKAQQQKALQPEQGFVQKYQAAYQQLLQIGMTPQEAGKRAAQIASGAPWQESKTENPKKDWIRITKDDPRSQGLVAEQDGTYLIPPQWAPPKPVKADKPQPPARPQALPSYTNRQGQRVTPIFDPNEGKVVREEVLKNEPQPKANKTGQRKEATIAQRLQVDNKHSDNMRKEVERYKKELEKIWEPVKDILFSKSVTSTAKREAAKAAAAAAAAQHERNKEAINQNYTFQQQLLEAQGIDQANAEAEREAKQEEKARKRLSMGSAHGLK